MNEILIKNRGAVRIVTMNRPDKLNALNTALTKGLLDALRAAEADPDIGAVVLTGAGRSFCAGADTKEFSTLVPENPQAVLDRADLTKSLHLVISQMTKPVVGAVKGHAMGGGAGLALACDLLVVAENAKIGYPELKHGIVAAIVLANLVRQVGRKAAFELVSMGEPVDGNKAVALGMANRVVNEEEVLAQAISMAERIASFSRIAVATTKRTFHRVVDLSLEAALDVGRDANVMMRGFRREH